MVLALQENNHHYCIMCFEYSDSKTERIYYHNLFFQEFISKKPLCKKFYDFKNKNAKIRLIKDFKNKNTCKIWLNYLNNFLTMHPQKEYIKLITRIEQ